MNVLVLGAAVSGEAAARLARSLGHHVEIYDARAAALGDLRDEAFVVHSGSWTLDHLRGKDLVITSPGFPEHSGPITDTIAAGTALISELEFAARHLSCPIIAITGTNGKTTTTGLTADMLVASGIDAVAAGNIGLALSSVVGSDADVVVVEASSFQLRFIESFAPESAAIVNVAPDHLDWHGSFEAYAAAKGRIFEHLGPDGLLVYDGGDPGAARLASTASCRRVPVVHGHPGPTGTGIVDGGIVVDGVELTVPDVGGAFLIDLAIAATLAIDAGADPGAVAGVTRTFRPGPHRRRVVAERDGVAWVDDSKATNPHAALAAVSAYPSVVLIAGGRNKGLDLTPVVTAPNVKAVVALGEAAAEINAVRPSPVASTMAEAVAIAGGIAETGDTVLLAPGCASFDMFDDYGARGDAFASAVIEMEEETSWPAA